MLETEMQVSNIDDANKILQAMGFAHKSYQEKERITYVLNGCEIDIDTWPGIPTYFEVEGKSVEEINEILKTLGYLIEQSVSCTADEIYQMYGKSMFDKREIMFDAEN